LHSKSSLPDIPVCYCTKLILPLNPGLRGLGSYTLAFGNWRQYFLGDPGGNREEERCLTI